MLGETAEDCETGEAMRRERQRASGVEKADRGNSVFEGREEGPSGETQGKA